LVEYDQHLVWVEQTLDDMLDHEHAPLRGGAAR
jgi:hypothetical protein